MGADPNKHLLHFCQSGMVAGSRAYVLEPLFQSPEPSSPPAAAVSPQKPGGSAVFCNNQTDDVWEESCKKSRFLLKPLRKIWRRMKARGLSFLPSRFFIVHLFSMTEIANV